MACQSVALLSYSAVDQLSKTVEENESRYRGEGFNDLAVQSDWNLKSHLIEWDPEIAQKLDPLDCTGSELYNSLLVFRGLKGLTPTLACDPRLWARLCHVECFDYVRARWLRRNNITTSSIKTYFFASGPRGCRDFNAIGRLWWQGHFSSLAAPIEGQKAVDSFRLRSKVRLEMSGVRPRVKRLLARGIFRMIDLDLWFHSYDGAINDFIYQVDKLADLYDVEAFDDVKLACYLQTCLAIAKAAEESSRSDICVIEA